MARCSHDACGRVRPDFLLRYTRMGLRVDGAWFCSPSCVETATAQRLRGVRRGGSPLHPVPPLRLGVLLLHQGAVTSTDLAQALSAQRESGRRLGAELLHRGLAHAEAVLKALAAQAGARYLTAVDPACVRSGPGGLSRDEVQALGVLPIQVVEAERLMLVACPAPLPRAALSALRQLTRMTPDPLLVSDDDWRTLMDAYGTAPAHPQREAAFATVRNVADAAAQVAAAAAAQGSVTVTEAYGDTSVWLRINGPSAIKTLLMTREGESEWLAATTSR